MLESNDKRPKTVQKVLTILYITLGVGIIRSIMEFLKLVELSVAVGGAWFVILIQIITFSFLWLNIFNK